MTIERFDAVLFDCDGVLVDSEPITNGVLRDMLEELGWTLTLAECMRTFVGKAVKDERALIERAPAQPLTEEWMCGFASGATKGLIPRCQGDPGRGAGGAADSRPLQWTDRLRVGRRPGQGGIAIGEVRACCEYFEGPYLQRSRVAAIEARAGCLSRAASGLAECGPERCAVVEDTITGVTSGRAQAPRCSATAHRGWGTMRRRH